MTVVVGTAGHIDHGKTSLLRALTGIDADRLPEERLRGMTIDVGYAHLRLDDGTEVDFVDVPGHDRLIGNMLVGAGEIDAALLVVAADDGPRAQTLEHLGLLDALGIADGLAVVTKIDAVPPERVADVTDAIRALLRPTTLADIPILPASSVSGAGIDAVRAALAELVARVAARSAAGPPGPAHLAIDRVFTVRGRGTVVTGSLRGGPIARGDVLRAEPIGGEFRVRELQVHNRAVERVERGGRVALNLAATSGALDRLSRGVVLTSGPGVERSERLLVALRPTTPDALRHGMPVRLHVGTATAAGTLDLGRRASLTVADGRRTAIVRLAEPVAAAVGDPFVLRRPSPGETLAGGTVLDPRPPVGISRRRVDAARLGAVLGAQPGTSEATDALVALHGALPAARASGHGVGRAAGSVVLAEDVASAVASDALALASDGEGTGAVPGIPPSALRTAVVGELRRRVTLDRDAAAATADALIDDLVRDGRLVRDRDRLRPPTAAAGPTPALVAAMDRLVDALSTPTPPALHEAAAAAGCPPEGIRLLEADGRIVRVEDDLAWEADTVHGFQATAIRLATAGPMPPATFRDAIRASRRYALAILEDLDRRGILRRTPAGHVLGPRAGADRVATTAGRQP